MKLNKVVIVSKFGSKISEDAAKMVAKKLLSKKIIVYTIAPVEVNGTNQVESLDQLTKTKLDLAITLGGDGTTLRAFRNLLSELKNRFRKFAKLTNAFANELVAVGKKCQSS